MANNSDPTQADYDFDFSLPHGVDIDDYSIDDVAYPRNSDSPHSDEDTQNANRDGPDRDGGDDSEQLDDILMSDSLRPHEDESDLVHEVGGITEQIINYDQLPEGISEDEDAEEAFDRSWGGRQSTITASKTKLSPRRKHVEDTEDAPLQLKKQRQSIFGGPVKEGDMNMAELEPVSKTPGPIIGPYMSTLSLMPQEREGGIPDQTFNAGFDVPASEEYDASPDGSPMSDRNIIIPPDSQPAYELRQNIPRKTAFTYIDTDNSGNFDPLDEAKRKMLKINKAKAAKLAQQKKKKKQSAPKQQIEKLIVKLHFEAFGNVRNYTDDEQNWPDNWSEVDSECERNRQEYRDSFRRNTPGHIVQMPIEDPTGELDDLTGHPVARGCKCCRTNNHDCSMITNGIYPCMQCAVEDTECEPIVPAPVKGRCMQCVTDGIDVCSFEFKPGEASCDLCFESGLVCVPLPPEGYRAKRINIDDLMYGEDRPYAACTVCRQEKKRCSLKKKTDNPPCKYCKKHRIGCTFFDLPKLDLAKKTTTAASGRRPLGPTEGKAPEVAMPSSSYFTAEDLADMEMREEETSSRESTPEIEMEDKAGNTGLLTKIMTSFAHPIKFNVPLGAISDCNFCEMPMFGIVGHFEREVHVIRWYDGRGYTEVGGGHCEYNSPSQMCGLCTITRLQIIVCGDHQLEPAFDSDNVPDFNTVTDDLISAEPGSDDMVYQLKRWCSMCFSVAKFGCARVQPSVCGEEEETVVGCGLRLCDRCAVRLKDEFEGNIELLAEHMDPSPKISIEDEESDDLEGMARADVGFLKKDGLLMAAIYAED